MACCLHAGPLLQPHIFVQQHGPFSHMSLSSSSCQQIGKSSLSSALTSSFQLQELQTASTFFKSVALRQWQIGIFKYQI